MSRAGKVWQRGRENGQKALRGVPWYFVVDVRPAGATERQQVWRGGFRTEAEARAALNATLAEAQNGTFVSPSKMTVSTYLDGWLDTLATGGRRPATIASYRNLVNLHVHPRIGDVGLQALTALDLDKLYGVLLASGRAGGKGALSHRTVRYVATVIGKALSDAERKGLVVRNVARLASPPAASSARAPEMTAWSPAEMRTFLDATTDHHHGVLFRLACMTGLRRGELVGLRWPDLDLDAATLSVRRTIGMVNGQMVEGEPKSRRSRRTLDVDAATITALRRHRGAQLEQRLLMGAGFTDRGFVFAMPDGQAWNPGVVSRAFERVVASSGLPRVRFHDLRHAHASHLLAAGVNVKVVSERLGHASTSFTLDTYGHVLPGQQADAAAAVANLIDDAL